MNDFLRKAVQSMDEEQAREILNELPEEEVNKAVNYAMGEMLTPHLEDVRDRALNDDPHPEDVRRQFQQQFSKHEREEAFYDTLDHLVASLIELKENPQSGMSRLKPILRDPYTQEALLLIFDDEEHVDDEYSEEMKEFVADILHWVGAMVLPEMYDQEEVRRVERDFGLDPDRDPPNR